MKITVIIPVYRQPKRLQDMLAKLVANDYMDKEIIVAVDGEQTEAISRALTPFRDQITVHLNQAHLGKVATLNQLGMTAKTDVLLFLDNDILLNDDKRFLHRLNQHMLNHDLAEIPKEAVVTSPLSTMVSYEFLEFAIATWLFARLGRRCPSMNGAAFAVRKKWFEKLEGFRAVVNEDMDFAARAFRKRARFGYEPALKVLNEVPVTLNDWMRQRKRWAMNNLYWVKNHFLYFVTHVFGSPRLIVPLLLVLLPFVIIGSVFEVLRRAQLMVLLPFIFMIAQYFHGFAGIFLWITHYHLVIVDGALPTVIALVMSAGLHYGFARYFKFKFNFLGYIFFYFIYSPIWIVVNLIVWIMAVFHINLKLDWKV